MRKLFFPVLFFFLSILVSCSQQTSDDYIELDAKTFSELKSNFVNPPSEYKTAPFWVWHEIITKEEIDFSLESLAEVGFGGVFMHPRYGMITEYLSEDWFNMIDYAVEKAKSLDMKAWIYDENSFPSGFAGGHVPAQMPESYNKGQGLELVKETELTKESAEKYTVILQKKGKKFFKMENVEKTVNGDFYCFKKTFYRQSKWNGGYSYVDLIYPGVTEKFIDITMTGYEEAVGDEFGKTVPGVFTDEPNIATPTSKSIRWTPDLFERFKERWGYDLETNLPSLLEEVGDWRKVRHNHFALLLELFIDRWSKPWYDYTEKNNLKWTGHYWEHGWPSPHHGGDNMAMYAYHQTPAIDMLFDTMDQDNTQFGNVQAVRELNTVSNQLNKKRTLSETYGAAGWELTFEDMKRYGDWEYVLGVNFMNQHLTYMTLAGDRKHDFPQSFSYHDSWWKQYKTMADYYARLSVALANGDQKNNVLVMNPTSTTWMYYSPTDRNKKLNEIGDSYHEFLTELEKHQIEYDLGCENIIKDHGSVKGDKFVVGEREYDVIVLPEYFENFDKPTFELMESYLKGGGKVVSFADYPDLVDGEKNNKTAMFKMYSKQWTMAKNVAKVAESLKSDKINFVDAEKVTGNLLHMRREFEDGQLLFLTNSSLTEKATGTLTMPGQSAVVLDAFTGDMYSYPVSLNNNQVTFDFEIGETGSLLLFVSNEILAAPVYPKAKTGGEIVEAPESVVQVKSPNVLNLDYCDLKIGAESFEGLYFYTAQFKIWQAHGYDDNPWVSSSQFKTEWVDADTFGTNTGFDASFPFLVDENVDDFSSFQVVVERPELWDVLVNGNIVEPVAGEWWLDRKFGVYKIGDFVQAGKNIITLSTHPMSIYAELEPVYILGDFALKSQSQGWEIVPTKSVNLGDWKSQGYPFYSDVVSYSKTVNLDKGNVFAVKLNEWAGVVADVTVNGKNVGIIGWRPNQLYISDYVKDGENEITVQVYGSLKNLLGPHHNVNRRGIVTPWSFKYAPEVQPKGDKYDLEKYGLFDDFEIIKF